MTYLKVDLRVFISSLCRLDNFNGLLVVVAAAAAAAGSENLSSCHFDQSPFPSSSVHEECERVGTEGGDGARGDVTGCEGRKNETVCVCVCVYEEVYMAHIPSH